MAEQYIFYFEELEIYHLDPSMINLLHIYKNMVEINFGNVKHGRPFWAKRTNYVG